MAWGYALLIVLGLILICLGFYGAFEYRGKKILKDLMAILIPLGLIIAILGLLLTVLPDFFKETVW